jgi:UDP-N-acetylglucosamine acyltransferase
VNVVALKRKNFSTPAIRALSEAHRLLYRSRVGVNHAKEILTANGMYLPEVAVLFDFIDDSSEGRHGRGRDKRRAA